MFAFWLLFFSVKLYSNIDVIKKKELIEFDIFHLKNFLKYAMQNSFDVTIAQIKVASM